MQRMHDWLAPVGVFDTRFPHILYNRRASVAEKALIDKLIHKERCFFKPLRYDISNAEQLATAVLLDTSEPVPLHIIAATEGVELGRANLASGLGKAWTWGITGSMPSLPSLEYVTLPEAGSANFTPISTIQSGGWPARPSMVYAVFLYSCNGDAMLVKVAKMFEDGRPLARNRAVTQLPVHVGKLSM